MLSHCLLNIRILLLLLVALLSFHVKAGLKEMNVETLFESGKRCVENPELADSAIMYYDEVLRRFVSDSSNDGIQYRARALNNRGYVWQYLKLDYERAVRDLLHSIDLCETLPRPVPTEAFACLNLGNLFDSYSQNQERSTRYKERAMTYWKRSVEVAAGLKEWEIMLRAYCPMSVMGFEEAADRNDFSALKPLGDIVVNADIPNGIPMKRYCLKRAEALAALSRNDIPQAIALFQQEPNLIDTSLTPERYELDTYGCLALCYGLLNRQDSVRYYMSAIDSVIGRYGLKDLDPISTRAKMSFGEKVAPGFHPDSLRQTFRIQTQEMLNDHKLGSISEIFLESEVDKSRERDKNHIKDQSRSVRIIIIVSVGLLLVFIISVWLLLRLRKANRRNRELYEQAHKAAARSSLPVAEENSSGTHTPASGELASRLAATTAEKESAPMGKKYAGSNLNQENLTAILQRAMTVLDSTEEIFSSDFTLTRLAEMSETKPRYLSQAISEIDGRNFNAMVNERRVKEACRRFDDTEHYGSLTVEAVGQEVGFKSRSSFTAAFKLITGMTPSAYARIARGRKAD